ncbi:TRC40/GET3/ArsA family transport-energizing ATPase [Ornithinimicrobium humiphilum]|uniref:Arsenite efflux ATP-binding protein ArsA n=1 Tax=Ornithinimicrobium humiphilum TaxID=125288 RepID=A0A543KL11_9MICO|nr:ArsA family ATPase [Ornithinimicrobium humiphilum]TQM95710.1 arsenite efflux ATP-binding protein ArsA [Ornithinimicrobium humiphilum]
MSSPLSELALRRDVLFVGGKGGVGKTAVASALALHAARSGRPTLVVSTDPAHNLGHLWRREVGDTPVELAPLLRGVEIDPARTTEEHLSAVRATMRRLMPEHLEREVDRHLELARDAPGTHEAAVLERIAEVVEQRHPDELVVLDTAPSGHTTRLVALPELMQAWTERLLRRQDRSARFGAALRGLEVDDVAADVVGGSRRPAPDRRARRDAEIRAILDRRQQRFRHLREVLQDPAASGFVVVTAAERLPVLESVELHAQLTRSGMDVAALVVNKRSPADAGELLAARRRLEDGYVEQLRSALPDLPVVQVPLLPGEVVGEAGLEALLAHLL